MIIPTRNLSSALLYQAAATSYLKNDYSNTQFVFCAAVPGCGKTFTGDYLSLEHNYSHIDGDEPLKTCRRKDITWNFMKAYQLYVQPNDEDGPEHLWQPYMAEIAMQALDVALTSNKVVLTFAAFRQSFREYVINTWIDADVDVKLNSLYHRFKRDHEAVGSSIEEYLSAYGWDIQGEITCDDFIHYVKETNLMRWGESNACWEEIPSNYKYLKTVDVSGRDIRCLDKIDEALNISGERSGETSYKDIRDNIKSIDDKRSELYAETLPFLAQLRKDAVALSKGENVDETKYFS
ncbi:hypothetical protein ACHAWT_000091 [Skeletonema menzelii]